MSAPPCMVRRLMPPPWPYSCGAGCRRCRLRRGATRRRCASPQAAGVGGGTRLTKCPNVKMANHAPPILRTRVPAVPKTSGNTVRSFLMVADR
eukprot:8085011-Pyramimonas_sp.AAC.1